MTSIAILSGIFKYHINISLLFAHGYFYFMLMHVQTNRIVGVLYMDGVKDIIKFSTEGKSSIIRNFTQHFYFVFLIWILFVGIEQRATVVCTLAVFNEVI